MDGFRVEDHLPLILRRAQVMYLLSKSEAGIRQLVNEKKLTPLEGKLVTFHRDDVLACAKSIREKQPS